jgi:prepilin-type N-terminal cleavage/methylation domain-containing protein
MQRRQAFTLIEIVVSVFILLLLLLLAVPSLNGVLADRRLRTSIDSFNRLVLQAQDRSVTDRRPYLLVWHSKNIELRPEAFANGEEKKPTAILPVSRGAAYTLSLPAALTKNPAAEWIFWPSGNCEPAVVGYKGPEGSWMAEYSALTARGKLTRYAAK